MDASVLKYIIFGSIGLLVIAGIAYFALAKQMGKSEYARIKKLQQGTKTSGFSMDVLYQRLYITFIARHVLNRESLIPQFNPLHEIHLLPAY